MSSSYILDERADLGTHAFPYEVLKTNYSSLELTRLYSDELPPEESRDAKEPETTDITESDYYPQHTPTFLQYCALNSRGVLLHYWAMGFALAFMRNPITYYLVRVKDVEPEFLNVLVTLIFLPYFFQNIFWNYVR